MAAVTWGLWRERNERVWSSKVTNEERVVSSVVEEVRSWCQSRGVNPGPRRVEERRCPKWHKPPATFVKINCDAAIFEDENAYGIGIVIRDEEGELAGYKLEKRLGCPPVVECEAEAVVMALKWADELGMRRAIVETDSQTTQMALYKEGGDRTEFESIIMRGKSLLKNQPRVKVVFVRRSGNTVAHVLARQSLFLSDTVIGSESPDWLSDVLNDACDLRH